MSQRLARPQPEHPCQPPHSLGPKLVAAQVQLSSSQRGARPRRPASLSLLAPSAPIMFAPKSSHAKALLSPSTSASTPAPKSAISLVFKSRHDDFRASAKKSRHDDFRAALCTSPARPPATPLPLHQSCCRLSQDEPVPFSPSEPPPAPLLLHPHACCCSGRDTPPPCTPPAPPRA
eukprot:3936318-Rhodomonas_salina.3